MSESRRGATEQQLWAMFDQLWLEQKLWPQQHLISLSCGATRFCEERKRWATARDIPTPSMWKVRQLNRGFGKPIGGNGNCRPQPEPPKANPKRERSEWATITRIVKRMEAP